MGDWSVVTTLPSSRYTTAAPASATARSYLPHHHPEVVGPNHEANDALPPQELRERDGEQPPAEPEKDSQASLMNLVFCHDRPSFPDTRDCTSLRMPNANAVTRLGRTFAQRSLLLRTKDDRPIVEDLRERRPDRRPGFLVQGRVRGQGTMTAVKSTIRSSSTSQ